jgi:hypothetical protein
MTGFIVILGLIIICIVWFVSAYNGLVRSRQQAKNSWSQIDVQLKRRHDLIPNLVETAKGYMMHERTTLENITKARNLAAQSATGSIGERAKTESALSFRFRKNLHPLKTRSHLPGRHTTTLPWNSIQKLRQFRLISLRTCAIFRKWNFSR